MLSRVLLLLIISVGVFAEDFSRTLTTKYNPGFSNKCSDEGLHLIYSRGVSNINKNDVIHYVVTAGKPGPPTLMIIRTNGAEARLAFNCSLILSKNPMERREGIQLEKGAAMFSAGFIVSRMWEYNDTYDVARMNKVAQNESLWRRYPLENLIWNIDYSALEMNSIVFKSNSSMVSDDFEDDEIFSTNFTTPKPTSAPKRKGLFAKGGALTLRFLLNGADTRSSVAPRLSFTGNSSQLDVDLDNLNPTFNGSRFALTFIQMSSLPTSVMEVNETKSIDDEFTPGIFKLFNWKSVPKVENSANKNDKSFMQWKPVCYISSNRMLSQSQQMFHYKSPDTIDSVDKQMMINSPAYPWFSSHKMLALPMNISFGQIGDGFYAATNYTIWTASLGLGKPPQDAVSILVILVIAIGLGLPFIIIIAGFSAVLFRRHRARAGAASVYEVIN